MRKEYGLCDMPVLTMPAASVPSQFPAGRVHRAPLAAEESDDVSDMDVPKEQAAVEVQDQSPESPETVENS